MYIWIPTAGHTDHIWIPTAGHTDHIWIPTAGHTNHIWIPTAGAYRPYMDTYSWTYRPYMDAYSWTYRPYMDTYSWSIQTIYGYLQLEHTDHIWIPTAGAYRPYMDTLKQYTCNHNVVAYRRCILKNRSQTFCLFKQLCAQMSILELSSFQRMSL